MDEWPNLLVNLEKLLVIVTSDLATHLIVEELACTEISTSIQRFHETLHHDDLRQVQVNLLCVCRQVAIESELDDGFVFYLQLIVLLEAELAVDLHVAVVHKLHLVYLT